MYSLRRTVLVKMSTSRGIIETQKQWLEPCTCTVACEQEGINIYLFRLERRSQQGADLLSKATRLGHINPLTAAHWKGSRTPSPDSAMRKRQGIKLAREFSSPPSLQVSP